MIQTTGMIQDNEVYKKVEDLIKLKLEALQDNRHKKFTAKQDYVSLWIFLVKKHYPKAFMGSIQPTQKKIFDSIVALFKKETDGDIEEFLEWVMVFWPQLSQLTGIRFFDKKSFPCLETFCRNYKAIINAKISLESKVVIPEKEKLHDYYESVKKATNVRKRITINN